MQIIFCFRPEAQGVVCGAVYLIILFVFVPVCFYENLAMRDTLQFPFHKVHALIKKYKRKTKLRRFYIYFSYE